MAGDPESQSGDNSASPKVTTRAGQDDSAKCTKDSNAPTTSFNEQIGPTNRKSDTYNEKNYRLQKFAVWVQVALCVFSAFAVSATVMYTEVAIISGRVALLALQSTERAYLSSGDPSSWINKKNILKIPVRNDGHLPGRITNIWIGYSQIDRRSGRTLTSKDLKIKPEGGTAVPPFPAEFDLVVTLPITTMSTIRDLVSGVQAATVNGGASYKIGVRDDIDQFRFCAIFTEGKWDSCGSGGELFIDLRKDEQQK